MAGVGFEGTLQSKFLHGFSPNFQRMFIWRGISTDYVFANTWQYLFVPWTSKVKPMYWCFTKISFTVKVGGSLLNVSYVLQLYLGAVLPASWGYLLYGKSTVFCLVTWFTSIPYIRGMWSYTVPQYTFFNVLNQLNSFSINIQTYEPTIAFRTKIMGEFGWVFKSWLYTSKTLHVILLS